MRYRYLFILSLLCANCACANNDLLASLKQGQPKDVGKLIDRLVGCNHWRGEDPYDAKRKKEIATAIADLNCKRLARDEAVALERYASHPGTIKVLQQARQTTY